MPVVFFFGYYPGQEQQADENMYGTQSAAQAENVSNSPSRRAVGKDTVQDLQYAKHN